MNEKLTSEQMIEVMYREFNTYREDWKEYKKEDRAHRSKIDIIVTRHDEQIKNQDKRLSGIWKMPAVISGAIGTLIAIVSFIINFPTNP